MSRPGSCQPARRGDGIASVYILDANGQRQVMVTQYRAGTGAEDIAEMQTIINSIVIDN